MGRNAVEWGGGCFGVPSFRRQLVRNKCEVSKKENKSAFANLLFQCSIPGVGCRVDARGYISPQTKRSRSVQ